MHACRSGRTVQMPFWRPHADVERENSPPERLLHSAQPEAQEGAKWKSDASFRTTSRQFADPVDDGLDHGLRLLGDQRVARARDEGDGDTRAELVAALVPFFLWLERIAFGHEVKQRHGAGLPVFRLF